MEDWAAENWQWLDQGVIDAIWDQLHDPKSAKHSMVDHISSLPPGAQWAAVPRLFARAYDSGEEKLMEEIYASSLMSRGLQYRLLSRIRDEGDWPIYEKLLPLLKPQPGDLNLARLSDSTTGLLIFLENATPTQDELGTELGRILEEGTGDPIEVKELDLLLPLVADDKSGLKVHIPRMIEKGWLQHVTALVVHGAIVSYPEFNQALIQGPVWPLFRNRSAWLDLPYRVVLWLQSLERSYRLSLEPIVGRSLVNYIQQAL